MNYSITIGWLYPDLMSTYGDRGNMITLRKRCEWRGIEVKTLLITTETKPPELKKIDLLFGGGAQDLEQEIVIKDLTGEKGKIIKNLIESGTPALFVCGAPQLMGRFYEPAAGKMIEGLGIFDIESRHAGLDQPRLVGNAVASVDLPDLKTTIVGFENHGGRTILGKTATPFAQIVKGYGNNGKDKTEGVIFKNAIGCYFHGPLLPKNPLIADWLLLRSLKNKYDDRAVLIALDDSLEIRAHATIARRLGVSV